MKNPQTTIAATFLTHIISAIGDVKMRFLAITSLHSPKEPPNPQPKTQHPQKAAQKRLILKVSLIMRTRPLK